MNASEATAGLKSTSFRTTGGARFLAGTLFRARQEGRGVRTQSSVYFVPDQWREVDSPAVGSGAAPICPYGIESLRTPLPSHTALVPSAASGFESVSSTRPSFPAIPSPQVSPLSPEIV